MKTAQELLEAGRAAAALLEGVDCASVSLGTRHDTRVVSEFARLAGVELRRTVYFGSPGAERPYVICAATVWVGGVEVRIQGDRPATDEDAGLPGFADSQTGHCIEPHETAKRLLGAKP